jgi:glutathione S-transferase
MIRLYGMVPYDRSGRVRWMLNELGLSFEDRTLSFRDGDLDAPEFRAISPLGRVPALEAEGGVRLCETSVILDWLGRTHGRGSLDPAHQDDAAYRSWLAIASCTIDPVCFEFVRPDVPRDDRPGRREQAARDLARSVFPALRAALASRDAILEGGFSAVDIQVAASLHYADRDGRLADEPRLGAWLDAQRGRAAAQSSGLF